MKANKIYYHIIEENIHHSNEVGYQGYCETEEDANSTIKDLEDKFGEYSDFWIFTSNSIQEPPIITI